MAHGRVKKQLAWRLFQENALLTAAAFHATATQELDDIRRLGFRQPVAVIPNGLELPQKMPDRVIGDHRTALFLSRIHPKKGLINLVRAWARSIATAAPGSAEPWRLEIAGPDERGHRAEVQSEVNRLGLRQVVSFSGSMDDREKWQAMVNADLFVLPTFSENFGIVVAEALVAGLPVITTTGTPWQLIRDRRLGWWIEPTEDALAETLRTAFEMPAASLGEMGECARRYAEQQFKWNQVASQLGQFYEWLLSGGERPDFVFD